MRVGEWILDLLFPPKCAFCGGLLREEEDGICARCRSDLPWTGDRSGKCDFIRRYTAPFYYEGRVRQSLLAYKFEGRPARGAVYGRLIAEDLLRRETVDFDTVTWVPLSRRRERKRGYDQARLIAEAAAERLGKKALPLLEKIRDVKPQSRLRTEEARRANISGCYRVRDIPGTEGRRILIVDDIVTTGATLSECARMLMLAGAEETLGAAVACHRDDE